MGKYLGRLARRVSEEDNMSTYELGDYINVEFKDDSTSESEWMWVRVEQADDTERVVFGMSGRS